MKVKTLLVTAILLLAVSSTQAVEWTERSGIGIRGPVFAPMLEGDDFILFNRTKEPFMMGWNGTVNFNYGLSPSLVVNFSLSYFHTYDDTLETEDQSFSMNNTDNAYAELTGTPVSITANYYFKPDWRLQPYVLGGVGVDIWEIESRDGEKSFDATDLAAKIGGGLNFWISERFTFDVQGVFSYAVLNINSDVQNDFYGPGDWTEMKQRPFRAYFEPSVGLTFHFGGAPDTDKDGVKDELDQCPGTPAKALVDLNGCPLDSDGDGVFDGIDTCANTPEGALVDMMGCPLDTDGDGVWDGIDRCEKTPAGVKVDIHGCPLDGDSDGVPDYLDRQLDTPKGAVVDKDGVAVDSDSDGVPDGLDQCPDTQAAIPVDVRGCPIDGDQDGVADSVDQCLGTGAGVTVDEYGCPFVARITQTITLSDNVKYSSGSFELTAEAKAVLDTIALSMLGYPDTKIRISGFADASGAEDYNLELSQKRADAVRDYLAEQGVPMERMESIGYGEDPQYFIADNDTPQGRRKNRRVEIQSLSE
ncbi:MAG: OmpA family protein [candidate division Zixibacteria bacterium]|nr:OmpA family protein [candidate division Zixibacteria bacterium]